MRILYLAAIAVLGSASAQAQTVPPVMGLFHFYKSDIRLTGKIGTVSFSYSIPFPSADACLAAANLMAQNPGVDGGLCLDPANPSKSIRLKWNSTGWGHSGHFTFDGQSAEAKP